jgi:hypothetical protein
MDGVILIQVFIIIAIAAWAVRHRFKSERARQVEHRQALTRGIAAVGIPLGSVVFGVWIGSSPVLEPLALVIESTTASA